MDAICSATLTLTPQKDCDLVYQPDWSAAWITDLNLKAHNELEQGNQTPPQTDDEDPYIWGIGQHASNKATLFDIRLTCECNVGNHRTSPRDQLISLVRALFPIADQVQHSMALVTPYFEYNVVELIGISQIPRDVRNYTTGIRLPLPRTQVIEIGLLSSMNLGQPRVLCNSHYPSAAKKVIRHLKDGNIKMELLEGILHPIHPFST